MYKHHIAKKDEILFKVVICDTDDVRFFYSCCFTSIYEQHKTLQYQLDKETVSKKHEGPLYFFADLQQAKCWATSCLGRRDKDMNLAILRCKIPVGTTVYHWGTRRRNMIFDTTKFDVLKKEECDTIDRTWFNYHIYFARRCTPVNIVDRWKVNKV
jgi:hypothetical protein